MRFIAHFGLMHQSWPWKCLLLLYSNDAIADLKAWWVAIRKLEVSDHPEVKRLCKSLTHCRWTVLREICILFEEARWESVTPLCNSYIRSLYAGLVSTYMLELGFNDMRDAEARLSKHDQLGASQRQAVCIRSLHRRMPPTMPTVELTSADFGSSTTPGVMKAGSFQVTASSFMAEEDAGVRADSIVDSKKALRRELSWPLEG